MRSFGPLVVTAVVLGLPGAVVPAASAHAGLIAPSVLTDDAMTNTNCTLREAVLTANGNLPVDGCADGDPGADTIQLGAGTYSLTVEGDDELGGNTGDLNVQEDLTIIGAGTGATIIDGAWSVDPDRIFEVRLAGTDLTLQNLTIQDGVVDSSQDGGGVLVNASTTLTTAAVNVLDNDAAINGGGIRSIGTVSMTGGSVSDNEAIAGDGGGIHNSGSVTLAGVQLSGNMSTADGGAIRVADGILMTAGGGFLDNHGADGGAISVDAMGTAMISDATFDDNSSVNGDGGAIYNTGSATIDRSTFVRNSATVSGGAVASYDATLALTNATMSQNEADNRGGALIVDGPGTTTLNNVTVTGNVAESDNAGGGGGGGVYRDGGTMNLRNTILEGNIVGNTGASPDCFGPLTSQGHNLVGTTAGCTGLSGPGDITGTTAMLGPLADNDGPTQTHALLLGSPAIDTGDPAAPGSGGTSCAATDQRGMTRPGDGDVDGVGECDLGAFEVKPAPKEVSLGARRNRVQRGKKAVLTATVSPCAGHEGDLVRFFRKDRQIAEVATGADCVAAIRTKVRRASTYHAVSPRQDADHLEGVSANVKLKVKKSG